MDMPISQINSRLLARLPADLGLGLLFATGTASQIVTASGDRPIQFTLREKGYALRCKVAPSMELGLALREGQRVRATGHLSFSSQSARFHLLVRELELLPEAKAQPEAPAETPTQVEPVEAEQPDWQLEPAAGESSPIQLELADIPDWVYAMAPPEVRPANGWGERRAQAAMQEEWTESGPEEPADLGGEELLSFLLTALDRSEHEDVELKPRAEAAGVPERDAGPEGEPESRPGKWLLWLALFFVALGVILVLTYLATQL